MKKFSIVVAAIAALAVAAPAVAQEIVIDDPTNTVFTDGQGNQGYIEVDAGEKAVRACNENEATPAGDQLTGYIYLNAEGDESFQDANEPKYGIPGAEGYGVAGDRDGDGVEDNNDSNGTEGDDCPAHGGNTLPTP